MTGFMGLTFSAFAGICFVSGLAVLMGGKEHHTGGILLSASLLFGGLALTVMTIQNEEDEDE